MRRPGGKTKVLHLSSVPEKKIIAQAVSSLRAGAVIVFPTETSYGLGANAANKKAVENVVNVKEQPGKKEISVIVGELEQISGYAVLSAETRKLAQAFFPGPLTLIVPKKRGKLRALPGKTVAFRVPGYPLARKIAQVFGKPITATSANLHGHPAIFSGEEAIAVFSGNVGVIIDAGILPRNKPSTLFHVADKKIVRAGKVSRAHIRRALV